MSQNYRPYPKIQLSSPQFINLIPGHELISFKFTYSDGLLGSAKIEYGNVSQVPQIYFHHKSLYFKLGGHNNKINLFAGFNHQAMWGGEAKIFSGGLKTMTAYKYVVLGKPWEDSRVGNHFGTIDLAGEWKGATWSVFVYRQSIYEDGSLAKLSNIKDGLNGIRFKRPRSGYVTSDFSLNTFLLEYLYTKSQGGNDFDFSTGVFGRDNYFNHYVYSQGWSYKGNSLGTPIIGPKELNKKTLDSTEGSFTNNNRLYALHLALAASWGKVNMTAKVTFSNNFGTYNEPFIHSAKQSSLLFYAERPVSLNPNSLLTVSFAADKGSLYSNAVAILVGWKYRGILH
jgi:hypothetical protein